VQKNENRGQQFPKLQARIKQTFHSPTVMKTVLLKLHSVLLEITRTTLCRQDCEETHLTGPSVPVLRKPASALITQFLCEVCNTHSYFDNGHVPYAALCAKKIHDTVMVLVTLAIEKKVQLMFYGRLYNTKNSHSHHCKAF